MMSNLPHHQVTGLLHRFGSGEESAGHELVLLLYPEMKGLAQAYMRRESPAHTLQATALVNEIWVNFAEAKTRPTWQSRQNFFGWASRAMKNHLVDHARRKRSLKAGGHFRRVSVEGAEALGVSPTLDGLLDLSDLVQELIDLNPRIGEVADLRIFGSQTYPEISAALAISEKKVETALRTARVWLRAKLRDPQIDEWGRSERQFARRPAC